MYCLTPKMSEPPEGKLIMCLIVLNLQLLFLADWTFV